MAYLSEFIPDGELAAALNNLAEVCTANQAELGLSAGDLAEIQDAATDFQSELNAAVAAKASANAAVASKNAQRTTSKEIAAKWSRVFRANASISDSLLVEMQFAPHETPGTRTAPATPEDLIASANGDGLVFLKWNRAGNRQGTQFVVETRASPSSAWTILGVTTRTRYVTQCPPGQYVAFRVSAMRRNRTSAATMPVALWDTQESVALRAA